MTVLSASACGFLSIFLGYHAMSFGLVWLHYTTDAARGKVQPSKAAAAASVVEWCPLWRLLTGGRRSTSRARHPRQDLYASVNILVSSLFAAVVGGCISAGRTRVVCDGNPLASAGGVARSFALSVLWQSVVEYYWHRVMHLPRVYRAMHKIHHFHKSPAPFDDLCIHPAEAFGYYVILYSTVLVVPQHLTAFLLYMALMGTCGVLDHSGVVLAVPGYAVVHHDKHHELFECNFGFPFVFMDLLHGTFSR